MTTAGVAGLERAKPRVIAIGSGRSRLRQLLPAVGGIEHAANCVTTAEVLEVLKDRPHNAAVVDLDEPEGRESLMAIRQTPECADLSILGVTRGSESHAEEASEIDLIARDVSTPDQLSSAIDAILRNQEDLYAVARAYDTSVTLLIDDPVCVWIKSRLGILGSTRIRRRVPGSFVTPLLDARVAFCHRLVDELPGERLQTEDLWNLVLFLAVPWIEDEVREIPEVGLALLRVAGAMSGSRKVILWDGMRIGDELGPVGLGSSQWMPSSQDPLREALISGARDAHERELVDVFFKRRIPEEDVEALVKILGRRSP